MPLSAIQVRGLAMIVAGKKIVEVAAALNINERTIRRWKQEPEFSREFENEIESIQALAAIECSNLERTKAEAASESLKFLIGQMKCDKNGANLRIRCCNVLQSLSLQSARAAEARKWRMFVYYDRKSERARLKGVLRSPGVSQVRTKDGGLRTESQAAPETKAAEPTQPLQPQTAETPDNTGQVVGRTEDAGPKTESQAAEKADTKAAETAQPLQPQAVEIPDKTGQPSAPAPECALAENLVSAEKPDKTGHAAPAPAARSTQLPTKPHYQKPNHVPFYASVARRR
jgi:hypothetical protein